MLRQIEDGAESGCTCNQVKLFELFFLNPVMLMCMTVYAFSPTGGGIGLHVEDSRESPVAQKGKRTVFCRLNAKRPIDRTCK